MGFTFRILNIQILWHQMPKHKTRNTFYWITLEVNTALMKVGQFMPYYKRKKISTRPFCFCKELPGHKKINQV